MNTYQLIELNKTLDALLQVGTGTFLVLCILVLVLCFKK